MANRFSDGFKNGKRDAERSYSDYDYSRDNYNRYGSERQRDYAKGWDEARENKRNQEEEDKHREECRREEQRREQDAAERRRQEQYEYEQMMEEREREFLEEQLTEREDSNG